MWKPRAVAIEPVGLNVPVFGSYSSAEATAWSRVVVAAGDQDATVASRVAVWSSRGVAIEPVGLNVPVVGSYSSAEARYGPGWFQLRRGRRRRSGRDRRGAGSRCAGREQSPASRSG